MPARGPLLVATRCHQTPWGSLPKECLMAQNGLGQAQPLAVCFMALDRNEAGQIFATGVQPRVVVGPLPIFWQETLTAWRQAGILVDTVADVRPAQWEKAILNATVGPLCLATRQRMDQVWADAELRALVLAATGEGAALAAAVGQAVAPELSERAAQFFAQVGAHQPSVLRDPGELPWILGHLLAIARHYHLPTPALGAIAGRLPAALSTAPSAVMTAMAATS